MIETTIQFGSKGCGKSEYARRLLGLTPEEYEKYCKQLEAIFEEERQHQQIMNDIFMKRYCHFMRTKTGFSHYLVAPSDLLDQYQQIREKSIIIIDDAGNKEGK